MSTGRTVSSRVGHVATSLGWDHNPLLPHGDFTVAEAMTEIARQVPTQVAIESPDERVTYADVVTRANQVANALLDREPERAAPVVVFCGHGATPPIAICGVLHAGLIAAPLDAREPADRLQRMVDASGAQLVVAAREHAEMAVHLVGRGKVVALDAIDRYGTDAPSAEIPDEHPGLVLFTSGSTGAPKGVVLGHRDIVPRAVRHGARKEPRLGERRSILTSFGFTAAQSAVFGAFFNGATLCTYDLRTRGPGDLPDWVRAEQIEVISFVPSTLARARGCRTPRHDGLRPQSRFRRRGPVLPRRPHRPPALRPRHGPAQLPRVDGSWVARGLRHPVRRRRQRGSCPCWHRGGGRRAPHRRRGRRAGT